MFITLIETAQTLKTFKSSEFCIDSAIADGLLRNRYRHTRRRFNAVAFLFADIKKGSHSFGFCCNFFTLSSASLLDFFFFEPLLYFLIFII